MSNGKLIVFEGIDGSGKSTLSTMVLNALVERNFRGLKNYIIPFKLKRNWLKHFMKAIDIVSYHGGIAHLFTHSWEIEEKKDWSRFETALQYAKNSNLKSVTNGEIFKQK